MAAPDRAPVLDALDVVPHAVAVDDRAAGLLGDRQHAPVDMIGHAGDHALRRLAETRGPVLPHQIMVGADAARGDDHGLRAELEIAGDSARTLFAARDRGRFEDFACDAVDDTALARQRIHAVAEFQRHEPARRGLAHALRERNDDAGAGAPGDVKTRHRIAVTDRAIAAALRPADDRKEFQSALDAARIASRRPRTARRPRPTCAAMRPRRGRMRRCPSSPVSASS